MNICSHLAIFILSLLVLFLSFANIPPSKQQPIKIICLFVVGFIVSYYLINNYEGFLFEVTPWKTKCLQQNALDSCRGKCCPKGFYGQNVGFDYIPDKERLNNGPCPVPTQFLKNNPDNYEILDMTYTGEGYCNSCNKSDDSATLQTEWAPQNKYESFCGSCSSGGMEGFCGSCSSGGMEGFCGNCSSGGMEGFCSNCNSENSNGNNNYATLQKEWSVQQPYEIN